jgi:hypothetical protein
MCAALQEAPQANTVHLLPLAQQGLSQAVHESLVTNHESPALFCACACDCVVLCASRCCLIS